MPMPGLDDTVLLKRLTLHGSSFAVPQPDLQRGVGE
jgi:hypothetical protein